MRTGLRGVLAAVICLPMLGGFNAAVMAQEEGQQTQQRPRIGLALSGGGARGAAHVGVLKVLEELRIPIDYIAGTSMGSIIGGLYASGMTPEQIETALESMDWDHIFDDRPPREDRSFRRKRDDDLYLIKAKPGIKDGNLKLPSGLIQGQKFDLALRKLTQPVAHINDFDQLSIPFRAVASDIGTGESVVLGKGDIALAMRASMAVPGAFAATQIDGRTLVDGGITNNLPISVVRDMGADIVIAVDISSPMMKPEEVRNLIKITTQLTAILIRGNAERQIASLTDRDILIVPDLGDISNSDFNRSDEAIPAGQVAAEAKREALVSLSLTEAEFSLHLAARGRPVAKQPIVQFVRINNNSRVADGMLRERLSIREGDRLDTAQLEQDIGSIYGLDLFESVRYDVVEENGKTGLVIDARARAWGPDYLQFGLALTNDARGENTYNFGVAYLKTALNRLGGEIRIAGQVGADPSIAFDWYQPLDYTSRFFIEPTVEYGKRSASLFTSSGDRLAQYRITERKLGLSIGRELGRFGEARLGYRWRTGDVDLNIGDPILPEGEFDSGSVFARLRLDRLDNAYFPSKGYAGVIEYELFREEIGNDTDFDQLKTNLNYFHTVGAHTFGFGGTFNTTLDGTANIQDNFLLGGFLKLSGYDQNSISGQHSAILNGIYYRRFTQLKLLPWYIGGSIELGNVWDDRDDISVESAIAAGSLFLGADTPLGPLYIGYGHAEQGRNAAFMYLGKTF